MGSCLAWCLVEQRSSVNGIDRHMLMFANLLITAYLYEV